MDILKRSITYSLFPIWFLGAMLYAWYGMSLGWLPDVILGSIFLATVFIITVGERINPQYPNWNRARNDVKTDLMHIIVSVILLKKGLEFLFKLFLFSASIRLTQYLGISLWPSEWPLLLQLPMAMLVLGFFEYWWHRWTHEIPFLYRFHATHHSPARLYWVNTGRFHPIDAMVTYVVATGPLILLGVNTELLLLVAVWINVHGVFQHCNIHLKLGPLNWIFSMAELHRWHHSRKTAEANTNYGESTIFWDIVFGTRFLPKDRDAPENVGLTGLDKFPQDYLGQLASPFKWRRIEKVSSV